MKMYSMFFKDTKPFPQLVGLFFLFVVCLILSGGIQTLLPPSGGGPGYVRVELLMQALTQVLSFMLPAILFAILFKPGVTQYFKIGSGNGKWRLAFVAAVIMLLLMPFVDFLSTWNKSWSFGPIESYVRDMSEKGQSAVEQLLSLTSFGDVCLQLLVVALVPAVCEELFFRGGIQQILHDWWGNKHVAVLATALIFSLAHGDLYGLVPRFVMGLALGYLFVLSGSMLVNIFAHFVNNSLVVILYLLYHNNVLNTPPTEAVSFPWTVVVLCTIGAVLLYAVYFSKKEPK